MNTITRSLVSVLILGSAGFSGAEEVYFDTVSTQQAMRPQGASVGVFGGLSHLSSVDISKRGGGSARGSSEDGWFFGIEFGYTFQTPTILRPGFELEMLYLDSAVNHSGGGFNYRSETRSFIGMANATLALDFSGHDEDVGGFLANFKPYVGAGLGIGTVSQSNISSSSSGSVREQDDRREFTPAYNWFVGFEYNFSPEFSLYAEYRHLMLDDFGGKDITNAEFDLWTVGCRLQY